MSKKETKKEEGLAISVENPLERFLIHIQDKFNHNIIFSAKYGTGKSTFLKHFFETYENDYYAITLNPVNYAVSSNENIFELIKVDIIKNLFNDGYLEFKNELEPNKISTAFKFAKEKKLNIVGHIGEALTKLDPTKISDAAFTAGKNILQDFKKYEEEINSKLTSDEANAEDFALSYHFEKGSFLEFDLITRIIINTIKSIKKKKKVLIIDDLDRLDPEHIFRILNIFSCHTNHHDNSHKFEFDKVIIVCDIDNIENIFKHKYGENTEFDGYIDKFYSTEIFNFSNNDAIRNYVSEKVKLELNESSQKVLTFLIAILIKEKKIKLRNLIKHTHYSLPSEFEFDRIELEKIHTDIPTHVQYNASLYISSYDITPFYIVAFLSYVFGSLNKLKQTFENLKDRLYHYDEKIEIIQTFIVFLRVIITKPDYMGLDRYFDISFNHDDNTFNLINDWPKASIKNKTYRIHLPWIKGSKYNGKESYYKNYNCVPADSSNDISNEINSSFIIGSLLSVIKYIEANNLKSKLNIC